MELKKKYPLPKTWPSEKDLSELSVSYLVEVLNWSEKNANDLTHTFDNHTKATTRILGLLITATPATFPLLLDPPNFGVVVFGILALCSFVVGAILIVPNLFGKERKGTGFEPELLFTTDFVSIAKHKLADDKKYLIHTILKAHYRSNKVNRELNHSRMDAIKESTIAVIYQLTFLLLGYLAMYLI